MFNDLTLSEIYNKGRPFDDIVPGSCIVLIGTAPIGPAMALIKAVDVEQVIMTFGVDSELANAYMEARTAGATSDVYLVRINGTHAVTNIQDVITLTSLEAVESANTLQYEVITSGIDRYLTLFNPLTGYNASYYLPGKTITQVVSEINVDAVTLESPVYATITENVDTSVLVDEYFSVAQTDGADPQISVFDFPERVIEVLGYLDGYPISQVGILGVPFQKVYIIDSVPTYLYQIVADFAERKMREFNPCIVTIGASNVLIDSEMLETHADNFAQRLEYECKVSEFVNVVLGRLVYSNLHPSYTSFGVAAYCGLLDSIDHYESTTNKRMHGTSGDNSGLTSDQRVTLANKGYVTFITGIFNGEKQVRVAKGVNLARSFNKVLSTTGSNTRYIPAPLSNVSNVKLVQHIVYLLKDTLDMDEIDKISTLKSRVETVMEDMVEYVKSYSLSITEKLEGYAKTFVVNLEITPVGELDGITLSMQTR